MTAASLPSCRPEHNEDTELVWECLTEETENILQLVR